MWVLPWWVFVPVMVVYTIVYGVWVWRINRGLGDRTMKDFYES